jgi:hypothetical protein
LKWFFLIAWSAFILIVRVHWMRAGDGAAQAMNMAAKKMRRRAALSSFLPWLKDSLAAVPLSVHYRT